MQPSPGALPRSLPPSSTSKQQSSPRTPREDLLGDPSDFLSGAWGWARQGTKEDSHAFLEVSLRKKENLYQ